MHLHIWFHSIRHSQVEWIRKVKSCFLFSINRCGNTNLSGSNEIWWRSNKASWLAHKSRPLFASIRSSREDSAHSLIWLARNTDVVVISQRLHWWRSSNNSLRKAPCDTRVFTIFSVSVPALGLLLSVVILSVSPANSMAGILSVVLREGLEVDCLSLAVFSYANDYTLHSGGLYRGKTDFAKNLSTTYNK